jgi:multiple sugar transport system ATP-binding protein
MSIVSFSSVNHIFPGGQHAVRDFTLDVADGEFVVLVGPSGCGKTTVLRMMAGLEEVTSGTISIDGKVVNDVEPQRRDVAMVFQEYALYPQMTVADNIAFSLKLRRLAKKEIAARVTSMARTLGIEELLGRKPRALSGGQRQRVAMGRALVRDPKVFLMDEPLSNLDAKLRVQMRHEVSRIQRELGTTTIYVTHDQVEAMTMGQRVAVMLDGAIQQIDTPQELYDRPANMFVAAFIGSPEMNLIRAALERGDGDALFCLVGEQRLPLPTAAVREPTALAPYVGHDIVLGLRPAALEDAACCGSRPDAASTLRGRAVAVEILGVERLVQVVLPGARVITGELLEAANTDDEDAAGTVADESRQSVVVGRFDPASAAAVGGAVEIAVDMRQAHIFDPQTQLPM